MKQHATWRLIDEYYRLCFDIGCPDFELARMNRTRIAYNYAVGWWLAMEASLQGADSDKLPKGTSIGELPQVGKRNYRREG